MYLKEFGFLDCWKVSSVLPVFKNVGEKSLAKIYCPVNLSYVVREVFEKLVIISLFITTRNLVFCLTSSMI